MLTGWLIQNFKSIEFETQLFLKPITIIAGANSSGKSTVLQSILLISQTLQSRFKQQDLILNGEITRLGVPTDILHFDHKQEPLRLAGLLDSRSSRSVLDTVKQQELDIIDPYELIFDLTFQLGDGISHEAKLNLVSSFLERKINKDTFNVSFCRKESKKETEFRYDITEFSPKDLFPQQPTGLKTVQFLPSEYRYEKSTASVFKEDISQLVAIVDAIQSSNTRFDELSLEKVLSTNVMAYLSLIADVTQNLTQNPQLVEHLERLRVVKTLEDVAQFAWDLVTLVGKDPGNMAAFTRFNFELKDVARQEQMILQLGTGVTSVTKPFPTALRQAIDDLQTYFEHSIHYLGPLRDDPKAIYAIPTSMDYRNVGIKGEFTAAMLNQYGSMQVTYPKPLINPDQVVPELATASLIEAIVEWLQHMGLVDDVKVEEIINVGYKLNVNQSGSNEDIALTNVGVGVSQVLPTLVMCLLVAGPCTLLIEQPELHLHPKVQSILGDFFLGLTYCGKQCIVETHSEHIINRLFLRIALDPNDENDDAETLRKRIGILFVEKQGRQSAFREIQPNEYGAISEEDWPKGFLDQATAELQRKFEAAKHKRKKRKIL